EFRQFALGEESFQHQDPPCVVLFAQLGGDLGLDQRQAVGILERGQHARESVAVGVGLHHGEHLRAGRLGARARKVVAQCSEIDLGVQRARHAADVSWRWSAEYVADKMTISSAAAWSASPGMGISGKHGIKPSPRDDPHYNHLTGALEYCRAR